MDTFNVFVDTLDSSFSIRVGIWDTVLMIKQKIEISQAVPISKQTLRFKGKILQDHREIVRCNVLQNSRLFLSISPEGIHNNNQVIHQTKNSPAPSNSTQHISHGRHQHLPVRRRRRNNYSQVLQTKQSPAPSNQIEPFLNSQDWPLMVGSNNDQVLQTEKTPISLNSTDRFLGIQDSPQVASDAVAETIYGQDSSVMVRRNYKESEKLRGIQYHLPVRRMSNYSQELQTKQSPAQSNQIDEFLNSQGWPLMMGSNEEQVLQTEKTQVSIDSIDEFLGIQDSSLVASDSVGEIIDGHDSSVMVRGNYNESRSFNEIDELVGIQHVTVGSNSNTNQVVRPLETSYSVKEIINIPDSPVKKRMKIGPKKMTVMVMPFEEERKIPVEVNADDNVKELRKELVKMQERGQINLPKERYLFIHNQDVLEEDWSFRRNHVADGDKIEIFRAYVVRKGSTTTRVRSFGH